METIPTLTNDYKVVENFLQKYIFARFGTPRALISDRGSNFCNRLLEKLLSKYGFRYRVTTSCHPQANRQAEVSNRELKLILEKMVSNSKNDWSYKLDEALWPY